MKHCMMYLYHILLRNSDWVMDQLLNPLENLNPPYNLCVDEKDFLVGVPICDNMEKAIEGSKCRPTSVWHQKTG